MQAGINCTDLVTKCNTHIIYNVIKGGSAEVYLDHLQRMVDQTPRPVHVESTLIFKKLIFDICLFIGFVVFCQCFQNLFIFDEFVSSVGKIFVVNISVETFTVYLTMTFYHVKSFIAVSSSWSTESPRSLCSEIC